MRRFWMVFVVVSALSVRIGGAVAAGSSVPLSDMDLDGISVSDFVVALFRDIERVPFQVSPEVYADRRLISLHLSGDDAAVMGQARAYLRGLGYDVVLRGAVHSVEPSVTVVIPPAPRFNFVYRPSYRDVSYLVDQLRPLVPGARFGNDRGVRATAGQAVPAVSASNAVGAAENERKSAGNLASAPSGSATALMDRVTDVLVVNAPGDEMAVVKDLLPQLDTLEGDLVIRATVYEVTTDKTDGSALQVAGSILGSHLGINIGPSSATGDALSIKVGGLTSVLSALDQDSRFKTLSSPVAHARSGTSATFHAGQEVPVLGSVTYAGASSNAVQSVQYRSAGVILTVKPVRRERIIALDIDQELSSFASTTTGLNQTPTLTKRSLVSSLSVQPGEVVLLGGLTSDSLTDNSEGLSFIPDFIGRHLPIINSDKARTEIILVLQVVPAGDPVMAAGHLYGEGMGQER